MLALPHQPLRCPEQTVSKLALSAVRLKITIPGSLMSDDALPAPSEQSDVSQQPDLLARGEGQSITLVLLVLDPQTAQTQSDQVNC
jgi:hypothetical protein